MIEKKSNSEEEKESKIKSYKWVALIYILAEILGFLYSLSLADWRGGDDEIAAYTTVRIILFGAACFIYFIGRSNDSASLKKQGGCFLIGNIILAALFIYLLN